MIEVSRREMLVSAAATAALAGGVSTIAVAQTASSAAAWDLTDLYPGDAAWEVERQALLKAIPGLKAQKGTLGRSAAAMRAAFEAQSDINKRTSRLYTYASLKADEDRRVAPNQERKQQAQDAAAGSDVQRCAGPPGHDQLCERLGSRRRTADVLRPERPRRIHVVGDDEAAPGCELDRRLRPRPVLHDQSGLRQRI